MESEPKLQPIINLLDQLTEDTAIPKNLRKSLLELKEELLKSKAPLDVRSATANSRLEEISGNPNLPMHARTVIWDIMSKLETVK